MYMYRLTNNVHESLADPSIAKYMYMYYNIANTQPQGGMAMKERLHKLIDGLTEAQIMYAFTFLTNLFRKEGVANG